MAHGQGASIQRRTDHGKRAHGKDKHAKKAEQRERDPRYQEAMDEVRKQREALDEIIAAQKANPAMGATPGAEFARRQAELNLEKAIDAEDAAALQATKDAAEESPVVCTIHEEPVKKRVIQKPVFAETLDIEVVRFYSRINTVLDPTQLKQDGEGKWRFAYQTATIMLGEGYNIKRVIEYTGIGYEELQHIPLDEEGYGIVVSDADEEETP